MLGVQKGRVEAVAVHRGHTGDADPADLARGAETHQLHQLWIATQRLDLLGKERRHFAANKKLRLLGDDDVDAVRVRRRHHRELRLTAGSLVGARGMAVAQMIAMDVAQQHRVDLAQPRVVGTPHRAPGVIEDPRAVRVLQDQRPVEAAELAVMASQGCDSHVGRRGRLHRRASDADGQRR
jgi:hypothetical protein